MKGMTLALSLFTLACQLAGLCFAVRALMISRTPQAAIGWGLALAVFPYVAIPLFLIFGESKFSGYLRGGRGQSVELDAVWRSAQQAMEPFRTNFLEKYSDAQKLTELLRGMPATDGNRCALLVDGEATFGEIFRAIDEARETVIVQFYIIHDDDTGRALRDRLLAARTRGVDCRVLYDSVGSNGLTKGWLASLRMAGVEVTSFVTNRQMGRHFQLNFRNHRKLTVVDGRVAFLGGINAGDEYMGRGPLGAWRDTHLRIEGPAVAGLLVAFAEDWLYAARKVPRIGPSPAASGSQKVLAFASGPAETWNTSAAVYSEIIHDVRERLWLASPYFVPDPVLRTALAHAALRGVDVRILLPAKPDHLLPWLSSFATYPSLRRTGVRVWRYQEGFVHSKVLLADNDLAIVGSVNLDFRSFMLNFEMGAVVQDAEFASEVEKMLARDFARGIEEDLGKFETGPFWFRLKCRLAALMSPEQ